MAAEQPSASPAARRHGQVHLGALPSSDEDRHALALAARGELCQRAQLVVVLGVDVAEAEDAVAALRARQTEAGDE